MTFIAVNSVDKSNGEMPVSTGLERQLISRPALALAFFNTQIADLISAGEIGHPAEKFHRG